jgi:chitin synthase
MDHQQRPPRSARPGQPPAYPDQASRPVRPSPQPIDTSGRANVSFQDPNRADIDPQRQRTMPFAYQNQLSPDPESGGFADASRVGRKKSLVRPDRERIEPGHRQWHYRSHIAEGNARVGVMPSSASSRFSLGTPNLIYYS